MADRGIEIGCGLIKDYKIDICCFSATHAAIKSKNKDWLAWIQENESECVTCLPPHRCFSELKYLIKFVGLVQRRHYQHNFLCNLFLPTEKMAHLV